eukprot:5143359-Prorocentrum_lima.AAC.1
MTSSLVGSEMCIRDRVEGLLEVDGRVQHAHGRGGDVHELDPTVQQAGNHAAEVVHDAPAHADDAR